MKLRLQGFLIGLLAAACLAIMVLLVSPALAEVPSGVPAVPPHYTPGRNRDVGTKICLSQLNLAGETDGYCSFYPNIIPSQVTVTSYR